VQRGVDEFKSRYSDMEKNYRDIDAALAPHRNVIRSFGHSDAASISQMFAWFQALSTRPDESFPVLLRSFNYDPQRLARIMGVGGQQQQQQYAEQRDPWQQSVEQELLQQRALVQQQQQYHYQMQQAQTEDTLAKWAADKPYFNEPGLRQLMGRLLQPDQNGNAVIPLKDGSVDLDESYRVACMMLPSVAAKMAEQQRAADRQAAKANADRARRASVGLSPAAPGRGSGAPKPQQRRSTSVRESIESAIDEARSGGRRI
jgi:hypothetical protein